MKILYSNLHYITIIKIKNPPFRSPLQNGNKKWFPMSSRICVLLLPDRDTEENRLSCNFSPRGSGDHM